MGEQQRETGSTAAAIAAFLASRQASGLAAGSIALYRQHLGRVAALAPPHLVDIGIEELRAVFAKLASAKPERAGRGKRTLSAHTRASIHRVLRSAWYWWADEGLITPQQRALYKRLETPATPELPRPAADADHIAAMLDAIGEPDSEHQARDRAIVFLLSESGMRIAELCSLTDAAVDLRKRRAAIIGKGGKPGFVFWLPPGAAALARYRLLRTGGTGGDLPLLRGNNSRNPGGPLSPDAVRGRLKTIAARAGIELPPGAPLHQFRHGFAHAALDAGADISQVSQLMRHSSVTTTMRYLREHPEALAETHRKLFMPDATERAARRRRAE